MTSQISSDSYGPVLFHLRPHSKANREFLIQDMGNLAKGCNNAIVIDSEKINQAETHQVLLLKGSKFDKKTLGVVHRSPPIEKEKIIRVILKIDEVTP